MMKSVFYSVVLILIIAACTSDVPPSSPVQEVQVGEQLMTEDFDAVGDWDTYDEDRVYLNVEDGVYRGMLDWAGRYIWGVNGEVHTDAVIEVDLQFGESDRLTMGGIICRASPQNTGDGYYFLISAQGKFSIRRGTASSADELVALQDHDAIQMDGQLNHLRAVCVGNRLQFFVNGEYLSSVEDESYRRGYTGLTIGLPANSVLAGNVTFDNLRVWEATMP